MPTYEYQCTKCGKVFEVFHSITAKPKRWIDTDCEKCSNRAPVRRLIGTGAGIIFKGSGFYETDYRSDGYKSAAKAEKDARSKSTSDDSKKTESSKSETTASTDKSKPAKKTNQQKKAG